MHSGFSWSGSELWLHDGLLFFCYNPWLGLQSSLPVVKKNSPTPEKTIAIPLVCPVAACFPDCARSKRGKLARWLRAGCLCWRKVTRLKGDGERIGCGDVCAGAARGWCLVLREWMANSICRFQHSCMIRTGIGAVPPLQHRSHACRDSEEQKAPMNLIHTLGMTTSNMYVNMVTVE